MQGLGFNWILAGHTSKGLWGHWGNPKTLGIKSGKYLRTYTVGDHSLTNVGYKKHVRYDLIWAKNQNKQAKPPDVYVPTENYLKDAQESSDLVISE